MEPWKGERIVEVTNDAGRMYRVTLRPTGLHSVRRVIFGVLEDGIPLAEKQAAITLAQHESVRRLAAD